MALAVRPPLVTKQPTQARLAMAAHRKAEAEAEAEVAALAPELAFPGALVPAPAEAPEVMADPRSM